MDASSVENQYQYNPKHVVQRLLGGGFKYNVFTFIKSGKMIQFEEHCMQMVWNHHHVV